MEDGHQIPVEDLVREAHEALEEDDQALFESGEDFNERSDLQEIDLESEIAVGPEDAVPFFSEDEDSDLDW